MLPDAQEADDAAQEAIVQALNKLDQYQTGTNFNAWLYTIALNTCRDRLRRHKRRGKLREALYRLRPSSDNRRPAENAALRREAKDDLWRAVGELEEKHRLTVILRTAHDLSVSEIAQVMEVPEKTVYSRLYAAFRKLRGRLQRAAFLEP
jgi:RNA polymerase sigma-70 factor (ECF subfamily)